MKKETKLELVKKKKKKKEKNKVKGKKKKIWFSITFAHIDF